MSISMLKKRTRFKSNQIQISLEKNPPKPQPNRIKVSRVLVLHLHNTILVSPFEKHDINQTRAQIRLVFDVRPFQNRLDEVMRCHSFVGFSLHLLFSSSILQTAPFQMHPPPAPHIWKGGVKSQSFYSFHPPPTRMHFCSIHPFIYLAFNRVWCWIVHECPRCELIALLIPYSSKGIEQRKSIVDGCCEETSPPHFLPKPPTSSSSSQSSSSYSLFLKYRYGYGTYTCVQLTMCNLLLPSAVASAGEEHHNTTTYNLTVCICVWMCTWVGVYFFPYPRLSDEVLHNFMHNSGEGASPPSFREAAPGVFGAWGEIQVTIRPLPKKKRELLCNFQPEVPTSVCVCCFAPEAMPGFEINNVEKNNIISFVDRWSVVLYPKMCHERVAKSINSLVVQFCEINMNRSEELWNRK